MKPIPSLEALGLTRLEALAYAYLVAHPGVTGYRVSQGIGKPTANVYRALEALERKRAVTSDRAAPPLFRAVPPDAFFEQLEQDFMDRREIASRALASLTVEAAEREEGVLALKTREQVLKRVHAMLAAARRTGVLDAPADIATEINAAVADARRRGVRVVALVRGAFGFRHADTIADASPETPAPPLCVVTDAREGLLASFPVDRSGAVDAWVTRSAAVVRVLHDAVANELFYVQVQQGLREGLSVDELEGAFERCREIRALSRS